MLTMWPSFFSAFYLCATCQFLLALSLNLSLNVSLTVLSSPSLSIYPSFLPCLFIFPSFSVCHLLFSSPANLPPRTAAPSAHPPSLSLACGSHPRALYPGILRFSLLDSYSPLGQNRELERWWKNTLLMYLENFMARYVSTKTRKRECLQAPDILLSPARPALNQLSWGHQAQGRGINGSFGLRGLRCVWVKVVVWGGIARSHTAVLAWWWSSAEINSLLSIHLFSFSLLFMPSSGRCYFSHAHTLIRLSGIYIQSNQLTSSYLFQPLVCTHITGCGGLLQKHGASMDTVKCGGD